MRGFNHRRSIHRFCVAFVRACGRACRPIHRQRVREQRRQQRLQEAAVRFSSAFGMSQHHHQHGRPSAASFHAAADLMQAQMQAGFSDDDMDMGDDDGGYDMDDDGNFDAGGAVDDFDFRAGVDGMHDGANGVFGGARSGGVDTQQIVDGVDFGDEAGSYEGLVKEIEERWYVPT